MHHHHILGIWDWNWLKMEARAGEYHQKEINVICIWKDSLHTSSSTLPCSYSRYWAGTSLEWRLVLGNIIKNRLMSFVFEKTPRTLVPGHYLVRVLGIGLELACNGGWYGGIIIKRLMSFAFEKTPRILVQSGCLLLPTPKTAGNRAFSDTSGYLIISYVSR